MIGAVSLLGDWPRFIPNWCENWRFSMRHIRQRTGGSYREIRFNGSNRIMFCSFNCHGCRNSYYGGAGSPPRNAVVGGGLCVWGDLPAETKNSIRMLLLEDGLTVI